MGSGPIPTLMRRAASGQRRRKGPTVGGQVPVFGQDAQGPGLPVAYRDVVEVVTDAGPLRAKQVCQALGLPTEPKRREGCGSSPERPVARGWLVEVSPGLFRCAAGVAARLDGGHPSGLGQVKMNGRGSTS